MSMLRYVLPALAVAGTVAAQCSVDATTTIQNAGDATGLAGCATFSGSIAIATGTRDPIALNGIQRITGDLVVVSTPNMTTLSGDQLSTIDGEFQLNDVQTLSSLTFSNLATVGSLIWAALPNLGSFSMNVLEANRVDIRNTGLSSLQGISLFSVDVLYLSNNNFLQEVTFMLGNVSNSLILEANGDRLAASFPNLEWAQNMTFRNCPNVSIPALTSTNGSLGFYENSLAVISAPNLTTVGGSLSIVDNTQLSTLDLPQVKTIGGAFQVQNNTELETVDMPALESVTGALDFYGNFTDVQLPAIKNVRGAFNLQSSSDSSNITQECTDFKQMSGRDKALKGPFVCQGAIARPSGAGSRPSSTASGASASRTGAAGRLDVSTGAVMGLSGVLAAMFGLL